MAYKRGRQRPDPFALLLLVLALGMSLTLAYQVSLYHGKQAQPVARQAPPPAPVVADG